MKIAEDPDTGQVPHGDEDTACRRALVLSASNWFLGLLLALMGTVALLAGALDGCVLAPLFGAPNSGARTQPHVGVAFGTSQEDSAARGRY